MGLVIRLSMKESIQHTMIVQYLAGQIELEEACQRLNLHRTTFWRKCVRYQKQGPTVAAERKALQRFKKNGQQTLGEFNPEQEITT